MRLIFILPDLCVLQEPDKEHDVVWSPGYKGTFAEDIQKSGAEGAVGGKASEEEHKR